MNFWATKIYYKERQLGREEEKKNYKQYIRQLMQWRKIDKKNK